MKSIFNLYTSLRSAYCALPYAFGNGWAWPALQVTLEVTYRCNLRCQMCYLRRQEESYETSDQPDHRHELTTDEIKKLIRQWPRFTMLTFTGGELFLRPDAMELLQAASRHNPFAFISNGWFIDKTKAEEIIRLQPRAIAVSIDGPEKMHDQIRCQPGSFIRAAGALTLLKEQKKKQGRRFPILIMKTVITPDTVGGLGDLYNLAETIGVDFFTLQNYSTSINMDGMFISPKPTWDDRPEPIIDFPMEELKKQLKACLTKSKLSAVGLQFIPSVPETEIIKHYQNKLNLENYFCRFPWFNARISPFGDVYPCYNFSVGNIREKSFKEIWNGPDFRSFRQALRHNKIFAGCIGCCRLEYKN